MHVSQLAEVSAAGYGLLRLLTDAWRAWRRRRGRRRGVRGKLPPRPPCPVDWCIGHADVLHHPAYCCGHPQPCWNGEIDPNRDRRL